MRVQGYIELDRKEMSDEEFEQFNQTLSQYNIHYSRVYKDTREYYFCILEDDKNLQVLLDALSVRKPKVIGMWDIEGVPYGKTKRRDEKTGEMLISGDAKYAFDLVSHIKNTPKEIKEKDGKIVKVAVTSFKPLHGFFGWALCNEY